MIGHHGDQKDVISVSTASELLVGIVPHGLSNTRERYMHENRAGVGTCFLDPPFLSFLIRKQRSTQSIVQFSGELSH